jgi:divalent metal cation (Fe/Co/Zn/Cd) transporter
MFVALSLCHTVLIVAIANLAYFGIKFGVARWIESVALFADSIDFLGDTSINLLIFVGLAIAALNADAAVEAREGAKKEGAKEGSAA